MAGMNTGLEGTRRKYDTSVFEPHVLSNGIKAWFQKSPILTDEEGVIIAFLPAVGSQLDPPEARGTAHFFEHIPFRGTRHLPSKEAIMRPIERLGGKISGAETSLDYTHFSVFAAADCLELGAATLCEMVAEPLVRESDVAAERGVIAKEYEERFKNPDALATRHFLEHFFGNHPLNHTPLGDLAVIESMTADLLRAFHDRYYHAGNIQLVCGGSFAERGDALSVLDRSFGQIRRADAAQAPATLPSLLARSGRESVTDPACKRDSLFFVYPFAPLGDADEAALNFLAASIAGGMTSPLMIELREKRGIIYGTPEHSIWTFADLWFFFLRLPVPSGKFGEAQEIFHDVLRDLAPDYLLARQEERQRGRKCAFQHPTQACKSVREEICDYGRPYSFRETEDIQDNLTLEEVFRWRDYLLNREPFVLEIRVS